MSYIFILGDNKFVGCNGILCLDGEEVFRLRERDGDGQLTADFEIRTEAGELVAKVAKNNIVYAREGLIVRHGPNFSEVYDPSSGESVAKAEELSSGAIRVTGSFTARGLRVVITEAGMVLNDKSLISGNSFYGTAGGINIGSQGIRFG